MSLRKGVLLPTASFAFPTLSVDLDLLRTLHSRMVVEGDQYGFGDKIPITADSSEVRGKDVDCSGYVRWLLHQASGEQFDIGDGSWLQHDLIEGLGCKRSTVQAANLKDGALRIAFLAPGALGKGKPGHVALVLNDQTMESHSGTGPDSRPWDSAKRWMSLCRVYVLTAPKVVD